MVCGRPLCRQGMDRRHSAFGVFVPGITADRHWRFYQPVGGKPGTLHPKFFYCAAQQQTLDRAQFSLSFSRRKIFIRLDFRQDFGYCSRH